MADEQSNPEKLILRDYLALDRTVLANERTLLAYLRTAIMLLISGITIIKLFEESAFMVGFGAVLIPLSIVVAALGYIRFCRVGRRIHASDEAPYSRLPESSAE